MVLVTPPPTWAVVSSGLLGTTELVCNIPELFPHLSLSVLVKKKQTNNNTNTKLFSCQNLSYIPHSPTRGT